MDSNHRIPESKSGALPLGESPKLLVDPKGIEPFTGALQVRLAPLVHVGPLILFKTYCLRHRSPYQLSMF